MPTYALWYLITNNNAHVKNVNVFVELSCFYLHAAAIFGRLMFEIWKYAKTRIFTFDYYSRKPSAGGECLSADNTIEFDKHIRIIEVKKFNNEKRGTKILSR